jgi:Zn-dependent protease
MSEWVQCPACGLRHTARADDRCPQCHSESTSGARPAPLAGPPAAPEIAAAEHSVTSASSVQFPAVPRWVPDVDVPEGCQPDGYAEVVEAFRSPPKRRSWLWLGAASALAFIAISVLHVHLHIALTLVAVLLFHELGHWLAMRFSGQQDARIFFIPFFGAIATARSMPKTAGARAAIALAGPLPGIVLGVLLAALFPSRGLGRGLALMLLYVNVINLLPIGFLDGGKAISSLFLSRIPSLEAAFAVASAIPMGLLFVGPGGGAGIAGALLAGTAFAAVRRYRVVREARSVDASVGVSRDALGLSEEALRAIYDGASRIAAKDKRTRGAKQLAALMQEIFAEACAPKPTAAERAGFGFAWAAALAVGWAVLAAAGIQVL